MKYRKFMAIVTSMAAFSSMLTMSGCSFNNNDSGKTVIRMLQYKPEAVKAFENIEQRFNDTHDDIELKIESPNEAMTVLKTRLIKEDYPDIIGIGGDINYSSSLSIWRYEDFISDIPSKSEISMKSSASRKFE